MESRCKIHNLQIDIDGHQLLTIELQGDARPFMDEFKGKELKCKIEPFKAKRSLSANAYAFVLIDKLAEKLRISPKEVYRNAIRNIGGVSTMICCQDKAVDEFRRGWESNGIGWQTDVLDSKLDGCTNIICYYGSSTYDSKQMARLINNIVEECEEQGIETMPPAELERLKQEWR